MRFKILSAVLLIVSITGGMAVAGEIAVLNSAVTFLPDGKIGIQFEAESEGAGRFQIHSTPGLEAGFDWKLEPEADIAEPNPGLYQAVVPLEAERKASYYRVSMSVSPFAALSINEVMSDNEKVLADAAGGYWDWIEIFNPNDVAVDLLGYGLSDDEARPLEWKFPDVSMEPFSYLLVFASGLDRVGPEGELHAGFRLNADGEDLLLSAPDGRVIDRVELPILQSDQSLGRAPDAGQAWHFYGEDQASPRAANLMNSLGSFITPPRFSLDERFFEEASTQMLELQSAAPGRTIRYTLDGSPVAGESLVYSVPIVLDQTTVVRAIAYEGAASSPELAATFFFGADHSLPIVSLAAAPDHFEFRDGYLYGLGDSVLSRTGQVLQTFPFSGSNAWKDREVPVSVEFYESDRELGFQLQAGLQIFGGWGSRGYPQKSFALFARREYGAGEINYRVFPDKPIERFESLVLRNSGNDNQSTHQTAPRPPIDEFGNPLSYGSYFVNSSFTLMRDAMMQRLIEDVDLDTQAYRPAVVYLNGDYWGIYNLREKINEHYVIGNYGIEKGELDLIEGYGSTRAGDNSAYQEMREFIATRDPRMPRTYEHIAENYLEIDNFIDYHLAVIYFQNFDIGNIKSWRPRLPQGRFRWIVYDQDYGFNLWDPEVYLPAMARDYADYDNMFDFYTAGSGTSVSWPNGGGNTLLLRRMLLNDAFKERFIRRCADLLNGPFREERVAGVIEEMAAAIRPEIARHLRRWSWEELQQRGFTRPHQPEYEPFVQETWEKNVQVLIDFARRRPGKLRQDCIEHFQLRDGMCEVTVDIEPAGAGRIAFNAMTIEAFPWTGVCFNDYAIAVSAVAKPGFRFAGWTSGETSYGQPRWERAIGGSSIEMKARFEPLDVQPPSDPAVIVTEIQYHPAEDADSGDWLELHNRGDEPVDLEGWILRDDNDDREYPIPAVTLFPGEYFVLCQSEMKFRFVHPEAGNIAGDFDFGLGNGGDALRLYDSIGNPVLNIEYSDQAPWPEEADGKGRTLQLADPNFYSSHPEAWTVSSSLGGTPGTAGR